MSMNLEALKTNISDTIKESQMKLGFSRECIRLYFPQQSLEDLLECAVTDDVFTAFRAYVSDTLGEVTVSAVDDRYCVSVPPSGAEYIHTHIPDSPFLKDFLECIRSFKCTIEDIAAVFHRYSEHVIIEEKRNDDVDYLMYFEDGIPDSYRYCIHFEFGQPIYHRFTRKEFARLGL